MTLAIISKNGDLISEESKAERFSAIFNSIEQQERFFNWAWEHVPYSEAKERIQKLGYEIWEDDELFGRKIPETISRFKIWQRVDFDIRKPEEVEFEGMKLKIEVA